MTDRQIANRIQKIKNLEAQKKELEKQITAVQDELKAEMQLQNVDELNGCNGSVKWITFTAHRFDSKAFRSDHTALYNSYMKTIQSQRFSIA